MTQPVSAEMPPGMRDYAVVSAVIDLFARWLQHRREANALCNCTSGERDQIARELGVSVGELENLVRQGPHSADELPKLLAALNLDARAIARAEPLVMRDMERVCSLCQDKQRCRAELAAGTASHEYAEYCGNAPTLAAIAGENAGETIKPV